MKVAIGTPAYRGQVCVGQTIQAAQLAWVWSQQGWPPPLLVAVDSALLDKARNKLVEFARDATCDWLLMCDADAYTGDARAIHAMLAEGTKQGAAVIGAPVRTRKVTAVQYNVARGDGSVCLPVGEWRDRVVPVDRIATAFMAIRLGWLVKEWPHAPWFAVTHFTGWRPRTEGEDYAFCRGVRERHGLILADGRFEPVHVGASDETAMICAMGGQRVEI